MLKPTMYLNAITCAFFGGLFVIAGGSVAVFLGDPPIGLVNALGAALLFNAAHLAFEARKVQPAKKIVMYFVMGDALWVAATGVLVFGGIYITSPQGIFAAMAVAALVGAFAVGQVLYASQARNYGKQENTANSVGVSRSNRIT